MKNDVRKSMIAPLLAFLVGVAAAAIGTLVTGRVLYASVIGSAVSSLIYGAYLQRAYRASPAVRAASPALPDTSQEVAWNVVQNGVPIGQITDRELAAIQGDVANDWCIWFAQLGNLVSVPFATLNRLLIAVPVLGFWLILSYGLLDPDGMLRTVNTLRDGTPADLQQFIFNALCLLVFAALITRVVYHAWVGSSFGIRNVAAEEMCDRVRRQMHSAAPNSEMAFWRIDDGRITEYRPGMLELLRSRGAAHRRAREKTHLKGQACNHQSQ
ncbi:conserved membrane hypothetical protein [Burkholderia diffusa]|nr:conserved membrane hypothetical protein [Burkholderia diffusa]